MLKKRNKTRDEASRVKTVIAPGERRREGCARHWVIVCLCVLVLCGVGCRGESPPPRLSEHRDTESGLEINRAEGRQRLELKRRVHFQPSDFRREEERRLIEIRSNLWWRRRRGNTKQKQALIERLQAHVPWPYELRRRGDMPRGVKPWARLNLKYHMRLDRQRQRSGLPALGVLRFDLEIVGKSLPSGHTLNWNGFKKKIRYSRAYDTFNMIDEEIEALVRQQLPSWVVQTEASRQEMISELALRRDLQRGQAPKLVDETLRRVHQGGCFTTEHQGRERLYWMIPAPKLLEEYEGLSERRLLCTKGGVLRAEPESGRVVKLQFDGWSVDDVHWKNKVNYESEIDPASLQFLSGERTLCLLGEQRNSEKGNRYTEIHCFDAASGALKWAWSAPGTDLGGAVVVEDELVVTAGPYLRVFGLEDGVERWSALIDDATGQTGSNRGCLTEGGLFVFSPSLGHYIGFNVEERVGEWEVRTFGRGTLLCDGQGGVYFDEAGSELLSLQLAGMMPRWRFRMPSEINGALSHGGHLLLLVPWALYVVDIQTGSLRWQLELPERGEGLVRYDRHLFLVGEDAVYALTRSNRI